jgi:DNA-binding NtrC family response regulator
MQELYRLADIVANSEIAVLLLGETGTGKEVLAEALHRGSRRAKHPLVRVHCAALSESLLESELFGHEKGAFTGAVAAKIGLLEAGQGGTVFLDEIGELPPSIQVKLLRVLEERTVLPVGAVKHRAIDVRFIAATHRDLEREVVRGTFRRDLFFRLNGFSLVIPPLRERPLDVDAFAQLFVERFAARAGYACRPQLADDCRAALREYSWPGNVRELRNAIERAVLLCGGADITASHLPLAKMRQPIQQAAGSPREHRPMQSVQLGGGGDAGGAARPPDLGDLPPAELRRLAGDAERKLILDTLATCGGNQTRAAEALGIARRTLVKKLARYNVARPRKR